MSASKEVPAGTGSIFIAQPNEAFTMGEFGTSLDLDAEPVFRPTEFRRYPASIGVSGRPRIATR